MWNLIIKSIWVMYGFFRYKLLFIFIFYLGIYREEIVFILNISKDEFILYWYGNIKWLKCLFKYYF